MNKNLYFTIFTFVGFISLGLFLTIMGVWILPQLRSEVQTVFAISLLISMVFLFYSGFQKISKIKEGGE